MTNIGEGVVVTSIKDAKPGELSVEVLDSCENEAIDGVVVSIGPDKKNTDSSGEVTFSKIPEGVVGVRVQKHFEEADYSKFVVHYPRITRDFEAKASAQTSADIKAGGKTKVTIILDTYTVLDDIVFHRRHIDIGGEDKYGHWWTVFNSNLSFGWWPKYAMNHPNNRSSEPPEKPSNLPAGADWREGVAHKFEMAIYRAAVTLYEIKESSLVRTFRGVEGELNGVTSFGGVAENGIYIDPHHGGGDSGNEQFSPVTNECTDLTKINSEATQLATSYNGGWSWRLEAGNHCHTFQKALITHLQFEKFKIIK
ncbi:hypothetical protein [Teredinibacter haidensis]|uniref:hypothetical protein n=1 Tax=Teredinibacter haidensis TaxID=2731755 RepID=UPI0009488C30|nr:hypothetical protein [Teredinibacter haidensis]